MKNDWLRLSRNLTATACLAASLSAMTTACAEHSFRETVVPPIMRSDYIGDVAQTEERYATRRCDELGVARDTPEWSACLRQKGAARWALKNCGGPFNSTALWWPTLCSMADED